MPEQTNDGELEPYRDILGLKLEPPRLQEVVAAYRDIAAEIAKLRMLDLTDVHPAIVFEPTATYRKSSGR
jgi:hypothetical protein